MVLSEKQKTRYSRQIISPSIGEKGQEILSKIKVLQIGAGGLGSPFALYIVASGINELTIIDNDVVSISNLQRQILYNEKQINQAKAEMAKQVLSHLNSEVRIKFYNEYIDETTIKKYIDNQDFIVDCSDNFKTKFLVNRIAVENGIKCIIAGIRDFCGQIITINPKKSACFHCVLPESDKILQESASEPLPVIGVTPGILGTLEALEVIKTAIGLPNLENKLLMVDLLNTTFNIVKIKKTTNCICSK